LGTLTRGIIDFSVVCRLVFEYNPGNWHGDVVWQVLVIAVNSSGVGLVVDVFLELRVDLASDFCFRLRELSIEIMVLESAIVGDVTEVTIREFKQVIVDHEVFSVENSLDVPVGIPRYAPRGVNCISSAPGRHTGLGNSAAYTFCWRRDGRFIF